jgi:hypothetical protein
MKYTILMRRQSAPALITSLLLGMAMSPADTYSQEASPPDTAQQPLGVDSSSSIESRISEVPPEIIRSYVERGQVAPINYDLTSEERRRFSAALEVLTPLQKAILREHLRSISFVEGLPANAQTIRVNPGGPETAFDFVFNARLLGESLSEFATRRERQLFEAGDSQLTVSVVAGSMDAVAFVLVHEATHIVDLVLGLTPSSTPPRVEIPEANQTPFARSVWESPAIPVSAYRGGVLDSIPSRTGGVLLDIEKAQALYEDLERTPFVSVYASLMVVEDIAELVAWRQMTEKYGQPYRIEVRDAAGVIYSYEPMKSPLVQSRLYQLDLFDSPEILETP